MKQIKKVTVIMGIYNSNRVKLERAIDSILNQSYSNLELIICNDASTNGIEQYLYSLENKKIRIINNKTNMGLAYSLNHCLKVSTGDYIARMDDDDISAYTRIEKQVNFLELHPEIGIVGTALWLVSREGEIWGEHFPKECPIKEDLLVGVVHAHPTIMVRKEVYDLVGGYQVLSRTQRTEDYDLYMRMYANGVQGYNLQEKLFYYTQSFETLSKRRLKHRLDELLCRYEGFKLLELYPKGYLYLLKPIISGLIPNKVKQKRMYKRWRVKKESICNKKRINVYVATHKKFNRDICPGYIPLAVGKSMIEGQDCDYIKDNVGDNISSKNANYCELTAFYWIWKNDKDANIKGICHYRRFFTKAKLSVSYKKIISLKDINYVFDLKGYDVIVSQAAYSYRGLIAAYQDCGKRKDLITTRNVVKELYPDYLKAFDEYMGGCAGVIGNMIIAKSEIFDNYSKWLFDILFEVEKRTDLSGYSQQEARIFGYLSERLMGVYFQKHNELKIKHMRVLNTEQSHTMIFYLLEIAKVIKVSDMLKFFIYKIKRKSIEEL